VLEGRGPEPPPLQRERIRRRLLEARQQRVRPRLDDKQLTSWNALMIAALAECGAVLERPRYLKAAEECAEFILERLRDQCGRLLRTYGGNGSQTAQLDGYLEDHAFLLEALLALYEATFLERWFVEARKLADTMIERFSDPEHGGFFSTAADHEALIARRKDLEDAPIPSGASSAALGLLRLAALSGERAYEDQALGVLRLVAEIAPRHPVSFGHSLRAIDLYLSSIREVALVGPARGDLERVVRERLRPHLVLAGGSGEQAVNVVALLDGRTPLDGNATAYVCEHFACQRPVTEPHELAALLD
jgi:uncharacterized protein YyaL (SSP411 family)